MPLHDFEACRFQVFRDLHGGMQYAGAGRRNGQPSVFFRRTYTESAPEPAIETNLRDQPRLFVNLNSVERETWRKILAARSIADIAKEEGISRAAIYARIRGNSRCQGGMIAKSPWVLLWWRSRQRLLTPHRQDQ